MRQTKTKIAGSISEITPKTRVANIMGLVTAGFVVKTFMIVLHHRMKVHCDFFSRDGLNFSG